MAQVIFIIGALIFGALGALHAWYTFCDARDPRRLAPDSRVVLEAMEASSVRLSHGGTTMWKAWLGFNYSHSLGMLMFAAGCIAIARSIHTLALPKPALLIPIFVGGLYFWLSTRYWFRIPTVGIAAGTLCFAAAWLFYP